MAKRKKSSGFIKFLLFIIFLGIGSVGGYYIATKYLLDKEDDIPIATELGDKDITNNTEFSDTINKLHTFLDNNVYLYDANGMNVDKINNTKKLDLAYNYVMENKLYTEEQIPNNWRGSINCAHNYLVDSTTNEDGTSTNHDYCKLNIITLDTLNSALKSIFNAGTVTLEDEYSPEKGIMCRINENNNYMCGKVVNTNMTTGSVTSKFEIVKVLIDDKNVLSIYDKGYLIDTRSDIVVNPNYNNFYLHSYDSKDYYYELKSSENLTFKHTFNLIDGNYYYVSSEVVK